MICHECARGGREQAALAERPFAETPTRAVRHLTAVDR